MITVEWKPIPGFEDCYLASTDGDVRSVDRSVYCGNGAYRVSRGRLLKHCQGNHGYPVVNLYMRGVRHPRLAHRLIAETFLTKPTTSDYLVVDHIDGDRTNARLSNLRWVNSRVNADNKDYTRYLKTLLEKAGIPYVDEEDFY